MISGGDDVAPSTTGHASAIEEAGRHARERAIIAGTALFDADYYLATYEDVRSNGVDPLQHFLAHGAGEGRLPNPYFDTHRYRAEQMAPGDETNPLVHYVMSPVRNECRTSARFDGRYYRARYPDAADGDLAPLDHFLRHGLSPGRETGLPPPGAITHAPVVDARTVRCTVIVPVYNAVAATADCLAALLRHTRFGGPDGLLVIDDASTDPAIASVLAGLAGRPGIRVVRQEENRGYTRTVNHGLALAGSDDVVLLNSDTVVGPHWLRRLKATAWRSPRIGTVTAVSNAAGEFSVPAPGNHAAPDADRESVARAVADTAAEPFQVPTGNGFCLYLKRAMVDAVGTFDETAFPSGYGEENDLCMRAAQAGWVHLVDPTVYVQHVRSASFGERRQALADAGARYVHARYPGYEAAIRAISSSPAFVEARYRIDRSLRSVASSPRRPRPRVLYVISTRVGGTPQTNADLMRAIAGEFDSYALCSDGAELQVLRAGADDYEVIDRIALSEPLRFATHGSLEYDQTVRSLMLRLGIDLLHIRHLAWHGLGLVEAARGLGIPVVMSFHDYYAICPTVNLLDEEGGFHPGGVTRRGPNPLWHLDPTMLPMDATRLEDWQRRMQDALAGVSAFVTTSAPARRLIAAALPDIGLRLSQFHVVPHGRDFATFRPPGAPEPASPFRPLRILLPGNLSSHKGVGLIRAVAALDAAGLFEWHVLGSCPPELAGRVVEHGTYAREDFASRVAAIAPDLAAILSVWPETFCHTLTESWASGLPVVGVDIGAVGERIRGQGGGWLVDFPASAPALDALLTRLASDIGDRGARAAEVGRWQAGTGREQDAGWMADQYRAIYTQVLAAPKAD